MDAEVLACSTGKSIALMESLNAIISQLSHAMDDAGPLRFIIPLVIPVVTWFVRKPLTGLLLRLLKVTAKGIGLTISDKVEKAVQPAIQAFVVVFAALITLELLHLPDPFSGTIEKLLVSMCVAAVFIAIYDLCETLPELFARSRHDRTSGQSTFVVRIARFIVVFIGVAAILKVWNIDIGPVLTGMGLAGAAVALAAQDYLKNLIAGFNNAFERRFREGDWIRAEGLIEGTVESVDLRSTLIRRFDTAPVYVPNSDLANAALINFTRCAHRRIYWKISLTYTSSIDALRTIRERIEHYIDDSGYFVSPDLASRYVRIDSFSDSSIDMLVLCFCQSNVWADYLQAKEELVLSIKSIVAEAGGSFAFPSRSIYIEASPEEEPAASTHPERDQFKSGDHPQSQGRSESGDLSEAGDSADEA